MVIFQKHPNTRKITMDFNYIFDSLCIYCTYQKYIPFGDSSFLILLQWKHDKQALLPHGHFYPGLPYSVQERQIFAV